MMLDEDLRAAFRLLELPPTASLTEVREAYRLLSRVWHPDRFAGNADLLSKATAKQQELNVAYQTLVTAYARGYSAAPSRTEAGSDADQRSAYGRAGRTSRPPAAADRSARPRPARLLDLKRVSLATFFAAGLLAALLLLILAPFLRPQRSIRAANGAQVIAASVAVGGTHGCAAAGAGVFCWGDNDAGQRGGGEPKSSSRALPVQLDDTVAAVAAGSSHTCALLKRGSVHCWGGNYSGQLGNHSLDDRVAPTPVRLDAHFTAISSLTYHTCGVTTAGALHCWGNDTDGQLGVGRPVAECRWDELRFYCSDRPEPIARHLRWRAVSAGGSHSCAIDDRARVHCWGSNRSGQLGADAAETCRGPGGAQPCRRSPTLVAGLDSRIAAVAAGAAHTCALAEDGRVFCWGLGTHGQIGAADSLSRPAPLNTSVRFTAVAAGGHHSCALTAAGELYCWGSDAHGELRGEARSRCGGAPCARQPVRIMRAGVRGVAAGFGSTCIRRARGEVFCWGRGEDEAAASPRPRLTARQAKNDLGRMLAEVRWRAAAVKRFLHRNLVAPLETH